MKKLMALLLVMILMLSTVCVASAETMTLTLTVPEAEYTLVIPQNVEVSYRAETVRIGTVSVKDVSGFAEGKDLMVTVTAAPFTSQTTDTVMPFTLTGVQAITNGKRFDLGTTAFLVFQGQADGSLLSFPQTITAVYDVQGIDFLEIDFKAEDWVSLKPGDYTAVITFDAKVVEHGLAG